MRASAVSSVPRPRAGRGAVVLLDLDDTLVDHGSALVAGYAAHLRAEGIVPDDIDAAQRRWLELEERHYGRYTAGEIDFSGQRIARGRDAAADFGVPLDDAAAGAWFDRYFAHYGEAWCLFEDARPALDTLQAAGVPLGIITNGDPAHQARKMHRTGLDGIFDTVVCSGALGVAKPEARIFAHAAAAMEALPGDCWYLGDRLRTDARGARDAGMHGVWLERDPAVPDPGDVPRVRDLREFTRLVLGA